MLRIEKSRSDHHIPPVDNIGQGTSESVDDEFNREISRLGDELFDYSTSLGISTESGEFEKFNKMHKLYNTRINESTKILNEVNSKDLEKCEQQILKMAKECCHLIKEKNDKFYDIQSNWNEINGRMKETYVEFRDLSKGIKKRKVVINSIYLFLQADDVAALDLFWREYLNGTIKPKIQMMMKRKAQNSSVNTDIMVTEDNYRRYRKFIGE